MSVGSAVVLRSARMPMFKLVGAVLEAGPERASTHLSVVGVGLGHCEEWC